MITDHRGAVKSKSGLKNLFSKTKMMAKTIFF